MPTDHKNADPGINQAIRGILNSFDHIEVKPAFVEKAGSAAEKWHRKNHDERHQWRFVDFMRSTWKPGY